MTPRSRCALAAATALTGLVLAACAAGSPSATTSSPSGSASSNPVGATPAATQSPSRPGGFPGGPMATATGPAGTAECTSSQLEVAYTNNAQIRNGALDGMSHADSVITFTNTSSKACWTRGYPGVAAMNAAGHEIRNAARGQAANGRIPTITLAPGQVASAEITGNTASCTSLTKIAGFLITVPDQRTSAQLSGTQEMCLNSLGINPLQPGNAGGLSL